MGAASGARPGFHGSAGAMFPLVAKGVALTLVTLGLYRFWYVTSVRRFLWGATEIEGDALEYTGRGRDLFIGFLIALAVVIPLYVLFAIAGLMMGPAAQVALQPVSTLILLVLAQFALFRARRYRLTRTLWRGVRMGQSGSGFAYAGRSLGWGLATVVTLGLAYPFMRASLERYKMTNTWFGDQQGAFAGTGGGLLKRGILLWLIGWIFVGGTLAYAAWVQEGFALAGEELQTSKALIGVYVGLCVLAIPVLLALYQAIEFRWWAQSSSVGPARFDCDIAMTDFLWIYLGVGFAALAAALVVGAAVAGIVYASGIGGALSGGKVSAGPAVLAATGYFIVALAVAGVWQLFGARLFWKRSFESVTVLNLGALVAAQSSQPPANAFGEGIADALDFGGF